MITRGADLNQGGPPVAAIRIVPGVDFPPHPPPRGADPLLPADRAG